MAYLRVCLVPTLLGSNPSRHQMILDGVGESEVVVPGVDVMLPFGPKFKD
jgi:hypothetical protein